MKKTFLVASVAVAVLASSCSKNEVTQTNPGDAIAFKAFSSGGTKAAETATADVRSFTVHGTAQSASSYNFVDTYSRTGADASWVPALGQHYWPADGTDMNFVAYSPALEDAPFDTWADTQGPAVTQDMTITNISPYTTAAEQKDFMVAYKTSNSTDGANGVTLNFQHALSQIVIQAKNSNPNVMKVEVYGVKIGRVGANATLTLPTAETSSAISGTSWALAGGAVASYMAGGADQTGVVLSNNPLQDAEGADADLMFGEGSFMLIPQSLTEWNGESSTTDNNGSYISVLCKVYNNNSASSETPTWTRVFPSTDMPGFLSVPINTTWEPGKKYTYTLEFYGENGGGGLPDPEPVDPTDPDGGDGNIDNNPTDPVGGEITFTVTVADWLPAGDATNTIDKPMGGGSTSSQVRR